MSTPTTDTSWEDRMKRQGPHANLPASGGAGEMPYAEGPKRGRRWLVLALVLLGLIGTGVAIVAMSWSDGEPSADAPVPEVAAGSSGAPEATAKPVPTTTIEPETTEPPATVPEAAKPVVVLDPAGDPVPIEDLPQHEAVYRDGKLILQGTVPSEEVQERFREEAAAVIGADNVIVRYQIDERVPVPTDGRVRVDESFLFPKGSAEIDEAYQPIMQLGVTVMRLNPQAQMRIIGYTDDSGSEEVNLRLSQDRAQALRGHFAISGISPSRIEAVGRGETNFVAPNDTEANRGLNRRIEIDLFDLLAE